MSAADKIAEARALIEPLTDAAKVDEPGLAFDYFVTREGSVFSSNANWRGYGSRALTPTPNSHGYLRVRFQMSDGRRKSAFVHKLVAAAFLPPKPEGADQIRHLDGNKLNNRADNLAWGDAKSNADDREKHGTTMRGRNHYRWEHGKYAVQNGYRPGRYQRRKDAQQRSA